MNFESFMDICKEVVLILLALITASKVGIIHKKLNISVNQFVKNYLCFNKMEILGFDTQKQLHRYKFIEYILRLANFQFIQIKNQKMDQADFLSYYVQEIFFVS